MNKYVAARACLLAGVVPALLSPVLWPLVVELMAEGEGLAVYSSGFETAVIALGVVAFFALIIGLPACLLIGFPAVLLADQKGINRPTIMATIGAALSLGVYVVTSFAVGTDSVPLPEIWPLYAFFVIIGAACGACASALSNRYDSR